MTFDGSYFNESKPDEVEDLSKAEEASCERTVAEQKLFEMGRFFIFDYYTPLRQRDLRAPADHKRRQSDWAPS